MGFDQSTMIGSPIISRERNELVVTWRSSSPSGTVFQVYVGSTLAWWGTGNRARFPFPSQTETLYITVGAVGPAEGGTDFSASLTVPRDRVTLEWDGGYWEADDLAGFRVYGSPPGGAVDYSKPLATIPITADTGVSGWGQGGWGMGGWGVGSSQFQWVSDRLQTGTYTFAVAPYDTAGNENPAPLTVTIAVVVQPLAPAAGAGGVRLSYSLDPDTLVPTLSWLASPSTE
jgi:hypothetical protein